MIHSIVGNSVLPKCELDIPCVHFDKDGAQVGEVIITDVSNLSEGNFNLFSVTRLQKKGWTLTDYFMSCKHGTEEVCMVNEVRKYHSMCKTVESVNAAVETQRRIFY